MVFMDRELSPLLQRWGGVLISIPIVLLVLPQIGAVMRESDQAHVLEGIVRLVRSGDPFGQDFYNYDKTWVMFWLMWPVFALLELGEIGVSPDKVVAAGNWCASLTYLVAATLAGSALKPRRLIHLLLWATGLLSPCVLLSSPLLSSNLFAAAFFLLLCALAPVAKSAVQLLLCGLLACLTVGSRVDFALALPLLCFGIGSGSVWDMLRDVRNWAMFLGAVTALVIGQCLASKAGGLYPPFLNFKAITGFVVFGLSASCLALTVLLVQAWRSEKGFLEKGGAVMFLCLPLAFYSFQLFSPRHLIVIAILVSGASFLPRVRGWLADVSSWTAYVGSLVVVLPLFIGLKLEKLKEPRLTTMPSEYPTADGYWPMGATLPFLFRLGKADKVPIDHNQRVWDAWTSLEKTDSREVLVTPLFTLSRLRFTLLGDQREEIGTHSFDKNGTLIEEAGLRKIIGSAINSRDEVMQNKLRKYLRNSGPIYKTTEFVLLERGKAPGPDVLARLAAYEKFGGEPVNVQTLGNFRVSPRQSVFLSTQPFTLTVGDKQLQSETFHSQLSGGVEIIELPFGAGSRPRLLRNDAEVQVLVKALPQPIKLN